MGLKLILKCLSCFEIALQILHPFQDFCHKFWQTCFTCCRKKFIWSHPMQEVVDFFSGGLKLLFLIFAFKEFCEYGMNSFPGTRAHIQGLYPMIEWIIDAPSVLAELVISLHPRFSILWREIWATVTWLAAACVYLVLQEIKTNEEKLEKWHNGFHFLHLLT